MASDYGLNFGFRTSDETIRRSNGRLKTPAGTSLLLGTAVEQDNAADGYLKAAPADTKLRTGVSGLLVQEEVWDRTVYEGQIVDSFLLGVAKANRLSVVTSGAGVKIWLKNTAAQTRADGRVIAAVTMFNTTGADTTALAEGVGLRWDGTHWDPIADPTVATSWMEVVEYEPTYGRLAAVLKA